MSGTCIIRPYHLHMAISIPLSMLSQNIMPRHKCSQGDKLEPISRHQAVAVGKKIYIHTHRSLEDILVLDTSTSPPTLTKQAAHGASAPASRCVRVRVRVCACPDVCLCLPLVTEFVHACTRACLQMHTLGCGGLVPFCTPGRLHNSVCGSP